MNNKLEINETHLTVLKRNTDDEGVYIDYVPLINPMKKSLNEAYLMCTDNETHSDYPNEILDSDRNLRKVLSVTNFCWQLHRPYQGLDNDENLSYDQPNKLGYYVLNRLKRAKKNLLLYSNWTKLAAKANKKDLLLRLMNHELAYSLEKTYRKVKNDPDVLAWSHRKLGWTYPEFKLTNKLEMQFLTNFGYGRVSYFYLKLKYKNIDIIPFSEWIRYRSPRYDELIQYSQEYDLDNESWNEAMEYAAEAVNLCVTDEAEFIETYITRECKRLSNGLMKIYSQNESYDDESNRAEIDFKGEKITGALNLIESIAEYESIIKVSNFIEEIEQLNQDLLPYLTSEYEQINSELNRASVRLIELEPVYKEMIAGYFYLRKLSDRINHFAKNNPNKSENLKDLYKVKYENFEKSSPAFTEYQATEQLIRILKLQKNKFRKYISTVDDYFLKVINVKFDPNLSIKQDYSGFSSKL